MMVKIFKSKFYIYKATEDNKRIIRLDLGAFETESKAWGSMFRPAPKEEQDDPRYIRMERKPEFKHHFTVKGERIIKLPDIFLIE